MERNSALKRLDFKMVKKGDMVKYQSIGPSKTVIEGKVIVNDITKAVLQLENNKDVLFERVIEISGASLEKATISTSRVVACSSSAKLKKHCSSSAGTGNSSLKRKLPVAMSRKGLLPRVVGEKTMKKAKVTRPVCDVGRPTGIVIRSGSPVNYHKSGPATNEPVVIKDNAALTNKGDEVAFTLTEEEKQKIFEMLNKVDKMLNLNDGRETEKVHYLKGLDKKLTDAALHEENKLEVLKDILAQNKRAHDEIMKSMEKTRNLTDVKFTEVCNILKEVTKSTACVSNSNYSPRSSTPRRGLTPSRGRRINNAFQLEESISDVSELRMEDAPVLRPASVNSGPDLGIENCSQEETEDVRVCHLNSSDRPDFCKKLFLKWFSKHEMVGRNVSGKSPKEKNMRPLNPEKMAKLKEISFKVYPVKESVDKLKVIECVVKINRQVRYETRERNTHNPNGLNEIHNNPNGLNEIHNNDTEQATQLNAAALVQEALNDEIIEEND